MVIPYCTPSSIGILVLTPVFAKTIVKLANGAQFSFNMLFFLLYYPKKNIPRCVVFIQRGGGEQWFRSDTKIYKIIWCSWKKKKLKRNFQNVKNQLLIRFSCMIFVMKEFASKFNKKTILIIIGLCICMKSGHTQNVEKLVT